MSTREKKLKWKVLGAKKSLICGLHFEANCFKGAKKGRLDFNKAVIIDLFNNNNPFTAASASVAIPGPAPESTPRAALVWQYFQTDGQPFL